MALYTIILQFRKKDFAHQVEGASIMEALRGWFDLLASQRIPGFGDLSKGRLEQALKRNGPTVIHGMDGVHAWHGSLSGQLINVFIVETARSGRRSKRPTNEAANPSARCSLC
jgi:hypothetical protein